MDGYFLGKIFSVIVCQRERRATHTHTVAPVWRAELSCPWGGGCVRSAGGGVLRSAGRTQAARAARARFWGVFIIAVHRLPLCWVWGPGIAVSWSCQQKG